MSLIHDPAAHRLGRPRARRDPRDLRFARYLTPDLPEPPVNAHWGDAISDWGVMGNDRFGCCTCAAVGHGVLLFTAQTGSPYRPPDADVLAMYTRVTGAEGAAFDPATDANDNGAMIGDALDDWRTTGLGGHRLGAYAAVDPTNFGHMRAALAFFGAVDVGVNLPLTAQSQGVWDVTDPSLLGDAEPGSWGGHSVLLNRYDYVGATPLWTCVTWGVEKPMTEAWLRAYCDEAYALLSPDWVTGDRPAPSGFDLAALTADLVALRQTA